MTRYFHVFSSGAFVEEIAPESIPENTTICRGWRSDKLGSALVRVGSGKAFEPISHMPSAFNRAVAAFMEYHPKPAPGTGFDVIRKKDFPAGPWSMEKHNEFLKKFYNENNS